MKILGIHFTPNFSWWYCIDKTIKKCNSLGYTLKYFDTFLSWSQLKGIVESHFCSVLFYSLPIWAGCLSYNDLCRVCTLLYKMICMSCRDFYGTFSKRVLCQQSNIRSFNSSQILWDMITLYRLCTKPTNTWLTLWLIQKSFCSSEFLEGFSFFDLSHKQIGRNSFANWEKCIVEFIPLSWADLSKQLFKKKARNASHAMIIMIDLIYLNHFGILFCLTCFMMLCSRQ